VKSIGDLARYPSVSQEVKYGLNEGEGLQDFALVFSRQPLTAYTVWRARCGASPRNKHKATAGVVWRDDGAEVAALTAAHPRKGRATGRVVSGKTPLEEIANWLRRAAQVETAAALGLAVRPKEKP
jgi:hypothetical protein